MYQFTDGTFAEARRYCIHYYVVVEQGSLARPRLLLVQQPVLCGWCLQMRSS